MPISRMFEFMTATIRELFRLHLTKHTYVLDEERQWKVH